MALTKVTGQVIKNTTDVTVGVLTVTNTLAVGGTVSIGGTLTYEDVTNIDSVGLITARNGIVVGSGITLSKDGDGFFTGVTTATTFVGALTGDVTGTASQVTIANGADNRILTAASANTINGESNLTFDGTGLFLTGNANFYGQIRFEAGGTAWNTTYARPQIGRQTDGELRLGAGSDSSSIMTFYTSASAGGTLTERARIDSIGRLLLNTTTEGNAGADDFTIGQISGSTGITIRSGTTNNGNLYFSDGTSGDDEYRGSIQYQHANNSLHIATNAVERVIIDSSGRLLIGHNATTGKDRQVQLVGTDADTSSYMALRHSADANGSRIDLSKSRNATPGSNTIVQDDDVLGSVDFLGDDGTDIQSVAAAIIAQVDGTPGENDMPGRLVFRTTPDGSASTVERVRIKSSGETMIKGDDNPCLSVDRGSANTTNINILYNGSSRAQLSAASGGFELSAVGDIPMQFYSNGSEKMRLLGGNQPIFKVGGVTNTDIYNSSGTGNEGAWLVAGGASQFAASNTVVCRMNRKTSNGAILKFYYNGSEVGSVSTNANSLPSDRNYKTNISDLSLGLSLVNKLKPSQFNFKVDEPNTPVMYGLIAQELEESLISEGVTKNSTQLIQHHPTDNDKESDYDVDYGKLTPVLINAIKELSTEIETLKAEVAALKS